MEYIGRLRRRLIFTAGLLAIYSSACGPDKGKPFDVKNYAGATIAANPVSVNVSGLAYKGGPFEALDFKVQGKAGDVRYANTDRKGPNSLYATASKTPSNADKNVIGARYIAPIGNVIIQCDSPTPTQLVRSKVGDLQYSTSGCGHVEDLPKLTDEIIAAVDSAARSVISK